MDREVEQIKASLESASAEVASWSPAKEAGAKATFDPQHLADYYEKSAQTLVPAPEETDDYKRWDAIIKWAYSNAPNAVVAIRDLAQEVVDASKVKVGDEVLYTEEAVKQARNELHTVRVDRNGLATEVARLKKLVDAADYLQHCRRSEAEHPYSTVSVDANRKRVERASDHYDFLRSQVKL